MTWIICSYILRSKNRKLVLSALARPKTPSQIAKETGILLPHVSRALRELEQKGLVKCLTPNEKLGRIYALTDLGKQILEML
jgi:DNA-binding MarR family transcriptional regulator